MSTPLNVAVDIVAAICRSAETCSAVDVLSVAQEISRRHASAGYSHEAIADALVEESRAAGRPLLRQ
jgi:hypothetical protein